MAKTESTFIAVDIESLPEKVQIAFHTMRDAKGHFEKAFLHDKACLAWCEREFGTTDVSFGYKWGGLSVSPRRARAASAKSRIA